MARDRLQADARPTSSSNTTVRRSASTADETALEVFIAVGDGEYEANCSLANTRSLLPPGYEPVAVKVGTRSGPVRLPEETVSITRARASLYSKDPETLKDIDAIGDTGALHDNYD